MGTQIAVAITAAAILVCASAAAAAAAAAPGTSTSTSSYSTDSPVLELRLDLSSGGSAYSVWVDGVEWLPTAVAPGPVGHFSGTFGALVKVGKPVLAKGTDEIGSFSSTSQQWASAPAPAGVTAAATTVWTRWLVYEDGDKIVFETSVPDGADRTNASVPVVPGGWPGTQGNVPPIVSFPAFGTCAGGAGAGGSDCMFRNLSSITWSDNFCYPNSGCAFSSPGCPSGDGGDFDLDHDPDHDQRNSNRTNRSKVGTGEDSSVLGQGVYGGPMVLHDQRLRTMVVAPLDHFHHAGMYRNDTLGSDWELGVYSQVTSLPKAFTHRTLIMVGSGITATVRKYGLLQQQLSKTDKSTAVSADLVINTLGYWTDNGAYYYGDAYGHNLTKMAHGAANMEEVAVAVQTALNQQHVPIRYWQWDDWWYPGHPVYVWCVENWEMIPDQFPSGLAGMHTKLGDMPFLLYMPYWCQSGNQFSNASQWEFLSVAECGWECDYTFIKGSQSKDFHVALFEQYKKVGLSNYEQDFMVTNFLKTNLYRTDLDAYEDWAVGLNEAAAATGVPVQFCMAMPSDIMFSTTLDWVTNARASNDYAEGDNLIRVPASGLLMWSLGMRPSKDNFWTKNATDSPYQHGGGSPANPGSNCELNAIVAVLSTGPVGISDSAGGTDASLAMATCDANGTLLQPSKPLTPSDRTYARSGAWPRLPGNGQQFALWSSHTTVHQYRSEQCDHPDWCNATLAWFSVSVQIDLGHPPQLIALAPAADFFPAPADGVALVHREWHNAALCQNGVDAIKSGCVTMSPPNQTAGNRTGSATDYRYDLFVSHPIIGEGNWVLLGEMDKFASVSEQRFAVVLVGPGALTVKLAGAPSEVVAVTALHRGKSGTWVVWTRTATIGSEGTAMLVFQTSQM